MEEEKLILINQDGSYNYRSFKAENGIWTIIGTHKQNVNHKDPFLAIDHFKSEKGQYTKRQRAVVFNMAFEGEITAVKESEILPPKLYSKKDWEFMSGSASR